MSVASLIIMNLANNLLKFGRCALKYDSISILADNLCISITLSARRQEITRRWWNLLIHD